MRVNYTTDENRRLQSVTAYPFVPSRPALELPDDFDLSAIHNYIVEGEELVFSELPAPQPSVQEQIANLKKQLSDTDYIAAKAVDALISADGLSDKMSDSPSALISADGLSDILSTLSKIRSEYQDVLVQRQSWRDKINALESQEGGQDDA